MRRIDRATPDQAGRLFEIMARATEVGCGRSYPPEIIAIWHKGRKAAGMAGAIADSQIYALHEEGAIRGFIHIDGPEIVGLFVHPDDHGRGYETALFHFAVDKIDVRPVVLKATLNAVPFYTTLGCQKVALESVQRHGRDIYVVRMEWDIGHIA